MRTALLIPQSRLVLPNSRDLDGSRWLMPRRTAHAAITSSGFLRATYLDIFDTTQLAIDLDLETHKSALFADAITVDFDADTAFGVAPYDANEVYGTGWATGGVALTGTTFTGVATTYAKFDATDVSVAGTTLTAAMGDLIYADALAGNNGIMLIDFVTAVTTVAGLFEILWHTDGIWRNKLIP
jgi:hypothetical protein